MNIDLAKKVAIAESLAVGDELATADQIWTVVEHHFEALCLCQTCSGSGQIVTRNWISLPNDNYSRNRGINEGSEIECPSCKAGSGLDPQYVSWYCHSDYQTCDHDRSSEDEQHGECGWRFTMPIPEGLNAKGLTPPSETGDS